MKKPEPASQEGVPGNGKPKRIRTKKPAMEAPLESMEKIPSEDNKNSRGRLASDLIQQNVEWLVKPWIPKGMLSLVVGHPNVGKSTFVAWLIAQAGCACLLPGFEEVPEIMTLPRLKANKVNLGLLRLLDDRGYRLPRDVKAICRIMRGWEAELLVIDPIDSYMEDGMNENSGQHVRAYLESVASIAKETGAAVVGVRHPGKDRQNVMPGSRQWRAVPRQLIELVGDGGMPQRLFIRHYRDALGQDARPQEYKLEGERGKPRRFQLQGEMDVSLNDLAKVASDPTGRRKVVEAAKLIRHLFEEGEKPLVNDLVTKCRELGIGEHARDEAKQLLSVYSSPMESGGKWYLWRPAKNWPEWLLSADPK